ncbi:MAG: helix-turn-helix domain-containing protein [Bacteroidales bacterium]|nr:helix-turn-helix domain-containing protein [Bacteroidales bacterium]
MRRELQVLGKAVKDIQRAMNEKENAANAPEKRLVRMSSTEVTKTLKISNRTLYNYRRNGTLRYTKIGGKYLYNTEDVEKLLP